MTRRFFIQRLFEGFKTAVLVHMFWFSMTSDQKVAADVNWKLVNKMSLREITKRKLHHGSDRYLNPFGRRKHGNLWRVMRWKLFGENRFKRFYPSEPVVPVKMDWRFLKEYKGLGITFLKHATLIIKDGDDYIYIDPVLFNIFRFIKDFTPLHFDIRELPNPKHLLITHGHYDHLDKKSLSHFNKKTHIISPVGYNSIFKGLGMTNRDQLDWFDTLTQGNREITLLPCHHWTMRNPIVGPNRSLWGSYLIKSASGPVIYISGDTAYFDHFSEIGNEFKIDLAIFNLGAYEPRWFMADSHINPAETVRAFQELNAKHLMIVHWGTFRLGDEPVHFPSIEIKQEMQKAGLQDRYVEINHGQTLFFDSFNVV